MYGPKRKSLAARFWPKVAKAGADDCWLWLGAQTGRVADTHKYGYLSALPACATGPAIASKRAHVLSWELQHGPRPPGMVICHTCDVPLCVNPSHLFAAPQRENVADRDRKNRGADHRGVSNPNSRLSPEQVAEIRAAYAAGARQTELASQFGIRQPHVSRIVRGENWS